MTECAIDGERFLIDGEVTYAGRSYRGWPIEGLLMNSRMIQATFDDANRGTASRWVYPDTKLWDPDRNTREFVEALPIYRDHGLLAVTVNFQGGSPEGYSKEQPWDNSGYTSDGRIKPDYAGRMKKVLDAVDANGMVAILGCFYFGQDERLADEAAVVRAVENTVGWVFDGGWRNVLIEVNNECNVKRYEHEILMPNRVHELIERSRAMTGGGRRLLVGTSYGGGFVPLENVVRSADFLLLHGNGVKDPARIAQMVDQTRAVLGYRPVPVLFNEDDHFDFDRPMNNFTAAVSRYASWGYFDPGTSDYVDGYQSPPVNWGLSTDRKRAFFRLLKEMTSG
jgi:hypothetical protein